MLRTVDCLKPRRTPRVGGHKDAVLALSAWALDACKVGRRAHEGHHHGKTLFFHTEHLVAPYIAKALSFQDRM